MSDKHRDVEWGGERLRLLPQKAVFWPARRWLLLADLHLGKASVFRHAGLPVPHGTTLANLQRLDELIAAHDPLGLVILGDLLHARVGRTPLLLERVAQWREQHSALAIWLVRGNHDSHAGDPPAEWRMDVVTEPWRCGSIALCHEPQTVPGHFALSGHLHPVCRIGGPGRDSLRLPCFVEREGLAILPAFGEFTGGALVGDEAGQRRYAIGDQRVWRLPPRGSL